MKTNFSRLFLAFCLVFCVFFPAIQSVHADDPEETPTEEQSTSDKPLLIRNRRLILLQPLNETVTSLDAAPDIGIFFDYFNASWPWVLGVAAGIGVLQALIGGVEIMISGSGNAAEAGKTKIMWALAGLLMIGLAGFILRSLNPLFFN